MEHRQELGHKEPTRLEIQRIEIEPPTSDDQDVSFFHDFIAGGVAGSASVVVGHPMDTLKVRMQTAKGRPSLWSLAQGTKYGGPSTLFRGMAAPLSTACVVNAIIFSSYGWSTRLYGEKCRDHNDHLKAFVCGSFAGLVQALVICPMEHVKCRLQIQETAGHGKPSSSHTLRTTLRTILKSGNSSFNVTALYRGWCITCWREVPAFGAYFTLYDIFKDHIQNGLDKYENKSGEKCIVDGTELSTMPTKEPDHDHNAHRWLSSAISGGLTGAVTWAIVYPFDVIKTQIQTAPINCPRSEHTIEAVVKKVVKRHGWKHLFRGLTVTCLRAFPVNGIIFPVYEYTLLHVCAWES